jgi:hypothetical protein
MRLHSILPMPEIALPTVEKREKTRKSATAERNAKTKAGVFRVPPPMDELDERDTPGGYVDIVA